MNLLAADQRGVLSRVGQMVRSRGERSAWGIDLGPSGLKAVKLAWDEEKQQAVIEAAALIEHAKLLSHAANEAEERRLVGDTLKAFLDSQETKSAQVCVGMPGRMALSRPLEVPPIDAAKVPKFVEFEARYQFPFPPEQLSWDFQLFDGLPPGPNGEAGPADKESRRALLIGVKRTATQHFLESFQRLGLRVDALQTDFVGLHNLLVFEHFSGDEACRGSRRAGGRGGARRRLRRDEHRRQFALLAVASRLRGGWPDLYPAPGQGIQPEPGPGRATQAGPGIDGAAERPV